MKQAVMQQHREGFRKIVWFLFLFILLFLFPHISHASNLYKFHQISMNTVIEINYMVDDGEQANKTALQTFQEVKRMEQLMTPKVENPVMFFGSTGPLKKSGQRFSKRPLK